MSTSEDPSGYTCSACGDVNEFSLYVYSHWDQRLVTQCKTCSSGHNVIQGVATPVMDKAAYLAKPPATK